MFPDVDYKIGQVMLEPGDILFCFTDGCTDAKDDQGQLFGEPRLLELVGQGADSVAALLDRVDDALHAHIGAGPHRLKWVRMSILPRFRPEDRSRLAVLGAVLFLNAAVLESNEVVATSGFVSRVGVEGIPWLWAADMAIVSAAIDDPYLTPVGIYVTGPDDMKSVRLP